MNRRQFVAAGLAGAVAHRGSVGQVPVQDPSAGLRLGAPIRKLFPRLGQEIFLNAAGGTPMGSFVESGLRRYEDFWRLGPGGDRRAYFSEMMGEVRRLFAGLIGAGEAEIALAHCTKAGEQLVLDGLPSLRRGGNVVTNDLHFSGSLHNLIGLQKAGMDVRIVRNRDWRIDLDAMRQAIDNRTALVSVSLVSNVNGWVEPMRPLAELAHRSGAYVYADIIQAAGILPFQVADLGIDFAACSGYKWLYGPHGVGFLYVRRDLQEGGLQQRLFPGHASCNYPPWTQELAAGAPAFEYTPPVDASRYQPGHVGYLGYAALLEGLRFVLATGVEAALKHSTGLINRLRDRLDPDRYRCISDPAQPSPMATFIAANPVGIHDRLASAGIVVAVSGNRIRVSPAAYNIEEDVDALAEALNRVSP